MEPRFIAERCCVHVNSQSGCDRLDHLKSTLSGTIVWMKNKTNARNARHDLLKNLQHFACKRDLKRGKSGDVAAWSREARNEPLTDRIADAYEHDRDVA